MSGTAAASLTTALLSASLTPPGPNPSVLSFDNMFSASSSPSWRMMPVAAKSFSSSISHRAYCPICINRRHRSITCEVAFKSLDSQASVNELSSSPSTSTKEEDDVAAKIGAQVRVKVPLKVYHVPKVPELDLTGMEGEIKQYVGLWKGKRISANLPYKVEFITEIQGRGPVKFFAHLKEDEFEYI